MRYTTAVELELAVEILDAVGGRAGSLWAPPEPAAADVAVYLGGLEITGALPPDVLAALELDALERLEAAAAEP
jgi:hypothetical protein